MWSRVVALVLVLALWPALGETVETVVHFASHGDLAHERGDDHDDAPLGQDEHGCSGTFHLCASGQPPALSGPRAIATVEVPRSIVAPAMLAPLDGGGCGAPLPALRPPIA